MSIYLKRAVIIFIIMTSVVIYLLQTVYKRDFESAFSSAEEKTVVIDAGHGLPDGGAVSAEGECEEKINLAVAKKISAILTDKCYNVIMTRETHEGIYSSGKTVKEKKHSDMKNRAEIMNTSGADIFVSIHMNKFSDPKVFGAQVFYSQNQEESARLAKLIQAELLKTDENNKRAAKSAENSIYLMKNAKIPAVIVECGFLSNEAEANKLKSDEYRKTIAEAVVSGIEKYFEEGKNQP